MSARFAGSRTGVLAAVAALALAAMSAVAVAAAPGNDARANAVLIPSADRGNPHLLPSIDRPLTGNNIGATLEQGEPTPCGSVGATVWFKVYVPAGKAMELNTFGSHYDTVLAVYAETRPNGALQLVDCNDDTVDYDSQVFAPRVPTGRWYHIQVGGYDADEGEFVLNIDRRP